MVAFSFWVSQASMHAFNENTTWGGGITNQTCPLFPQQTSSQHKAVVLMLHSVQTEPPPSPFLVSVHLTANNSLKVSHPRYHIPTLWFSCYFSNHPFFARGGVAK